MPVLRLGLPSAPDPHPRELGLPVDELVLERAGDMQDEQAEQKEAAHAVPIHEFFVQPALRRDPARLRADRRDGSDHGHRNQVPDLHDRRRS